LHNYDEFGQLIEFANSLGEVTKFDFDNFGNSTAFTGTKDGCKTTYNYDPLGRRISKETEGVTKR
jgi:YD repeat-containing protein